MLIAPPSDYFETREVTNLSALLRVAGYLLELHGLNASDSLIAHSRATNGRTYGITNLFVVKSTNARRSSALRRPFNSGRTVPASFLIGFQIECSPVRLKRNHPVAARLKQFHFSHQVSTHDRWMWITEAAALFAAQKFSGRLPPAGGRAGVRWH